MDIAEVGERGLIVDVSLRGKIWAIRALRFYLSFLELACCEFS
jgi:hypothetical protein